MPRLTSIIVDSLALAMVGVCLTSIVVSYERNLPDPAARFRQVAGIEDDWLDPVTTGAIAPKVEAAIPSADAGSPAWVDPPRR